MKKKPLYIFTFMYVDSSMFKNIYYKFKDNSAIKLGIIKIQT